MERGDIPLEESLRQFERGIALTRACQQALKSAELEKAEAIRRHFLPFETLRDTINPIRVLHDGVTLAGIADMGPILPLLSNLDAASRERVAPVARALKELNEQMPTGKAA